MDEKMQQIFDKCRAFVEFQAKDESIAKYDGGWRANGPLGHIGVAVSNLLDATTSELFDDGEVMAILRCAENIVDLGY